MKRFLILAVLILVGLAFYLKWVRVASSSTDGKSGVTVTVDKDKIKEDERKAREKVQDLGHDVKDKAAASH
jgi:Na+/H+ antiporter NhaB